MRKMIYVCEGKEYTAYKDVEGKPYSVKFQTITPPDEVEARIKYNKERAEKGFQSLLPIHI